MTTRYEGASTGAGMVALRVTLDVAVDDSLWLGGGINLSTVFMDTVQVEGLDVFTVDVEELVT